MDTSFSQTDVLPRWMWIGAITIVPIVIGAAFWWSWTLPAPVQNELDKQLTMKLNAAVERREIKNESFISGHVKMVAKDAIILSVVSAGELKYRVLLNHQTKLYRWSNDTIPKKIALTLNDITTDSIITVISDKEIGNRDTIQAIEIIKVQ